MKINHCVNLILFSTFILFNSHFIKAENNSDKEFFQLNKNITKHKHVLQIGLYNRLISSFCFKLYHHDYVTNKLLLNKYSWDTIKSTSDYISEILFKTFGINLDYSYFINDLIGFSGKVLLLKNRGYDYTYNYDHNKDLEDTRSQKLIPYEFHVLPGIKLNVLKDGLNFLDKKQEGIRVMLGFHFGPVLQKINVPKTTDIIIDLQKYIEPNFVNWAILIDTNITFTNKLSTSLGFLFVWGQLLKWKGNELSNDDMIKISKKFRDINSIKEKNISNNRSDNINEKSYDFRIQSFMTINYDLTHCF